MKILIISDTHRNNNHLIRLMNELEMPDLVLHLGDSEMTLPELEQITGCKTIAIAGNNDFFSNLPQEKELTLCGKKILLTHGHYHHVSFTTEYLKRDAEERGIDIAMFGHTHRPFLEEGKQVTLLNPGSLAYPRQEGRKPSYMLMEIDRNGKISYEIRYIEKK